MTRYRCPNCRVIAKFPNAARFAFCPACGQALASFDRLPQLGHTKVSRPTDRGGEPAMSGASLSSFLEET
jgi:hypothetical protein